MRTEVKNDLREILRCLLVILFSIGLYYVSMEIGPYYRAIEREKKNYQNVPTNKHNARDTDEKIVARL